ncbi:sigma-70 family RNA polymerase sigma factor [Lawsonibacter sp. LCP25S3_G6]|uniref:sigma-70 family RNA polymerase sigma factor n=1 Tax=unclassified Lawsonibacter TaxID=2617946 RepID=UPI003F995A12
MEQTTGVATPEETYLPASVSQEEAQQLDDRSLLELYQRTGDQELKWMLVLRYTQLVRRIALQASGLYSSFAQLDDIIQEGLLVLLNAVDKFDLSKNVKFETYVSTRLRGMIVDLARRQDWLPRQVRQKAVKLNRATDELAGNLGRVPTSDEVAQYMGLTREQYDALLSETAVSSMVSFEAVLDSCGNATEKFLNLGEQSNPTEEEYQDQELHQVLEQGIASLRENERMVLSLYYEKELNMKEIAQVLGVSAARVSQIHSRALQHLRVHMKQYMQA